MSNDKVTDRLLSPSHAARIFRLSRNGIYRNARAGRLTRHRGGRFNGLLVDPQELFSLLERGEADAA